MTHGKRTASATRWASGWSCAAALVLVLAPALVQAERAHNATQVDDPAPDPAPAPDQDGDDPPSLEECACELAAGDGGCRSECNQSVPGKTEPNYCDGAKPSPACWQCVKDKCKVDLPR